MINCKDCNHNNYQDKVPLHSVTTGYNIFEVKVVIEQPDYIYICINIFLATLTKPKGVLPKNTSHKKKINFFKENVMSKKERN